MHAFVGGSVHAPCYELAVPLPAMLLVGAEEASATATRHVLQGLGVDTTIARGPAEARAQLMRNVFDVIVVASGSPSPIFELAPLTPIGLLAGASVPPPAERPPLAFVLGAAASDGELVEAVARCIQLPALTPEASTLVRRYFSCLERAAWSDLRDLCTAEVRYSLPGDDPRFSRQVHGIEALQSLAAETFSGFQEPRFAITSIRALPAGTLVRYDASWLEAGRRRIGMPGAMMFKLDGDRIAEVSVRLDVHALGRL